jgi:hypothetical protein
MLAAGAAIYGAGASDAFAVRHVDVAGASLTSESAIRAAAGVSAGAGDAPNLFGLATGDLRRRVEELPTVASASVDVGLPDGLTIRVVERTALLAWGVGDRRFLVDDQGRVFADLPAEPSDPRVAAQLAAVPVIDDERSSSGAISVGSAVDAVDFDVARRLGALRPADVGSGAAALGVSVSDTEGFVVRPTPAGWSAAFGLYTPTLRPPSIVPGQVRLLASLLAGREAQVGDVLLASETDGTYKPRAGASPNASATAP